LKEPGREAAHKAASADSSNHALKGVPSEAKRVPFRVKGIPSMAKGIPFEAKSPDYAPRPGIRKAAGSVLVPQKSIDMLVKKTFAP
jgi:hypothetical protein